LDLITGARAFNRRIKCVENPLFFGKTPKNPIFGHFGPLFGVCIIGMYGLEVLLRGGQNGPRNPPYFRPLKPVV